MRLNSTEGVEIPAHKLILDMTSSYLKSKIRKISEAVPTKVFQNVKSEVLSALIDFIYDGKTVISVTETETFIETAKKWKIWQQITSWTSSAVKEIELKMFATRSFHPESSN